MTHVITKQGKKNNKKNKKIYTKIKIKYVGGGGGGSSLFALSDL